jgi:hypothetical protein
MLSAEPCEAKIEVYADEVEEVTRIRSPPCEQDRSIGGPRHETAGPGDFGRN